MITNTPAIIQAGDTLSWTIQLAQYPASSGWDLGYVLINGSTKIVIGSDSDGDAHVVSATHAETAVYAPGLYTYSAFVSNDTERITVERGKIEVVADIATLATHDGRSFAEISLDKLDAVISGKASSDDLAYTLNGKSLSRYSWNELISTRKYFQGLVNQERRKTGGNKSGKVLVRFSTPGVV